MHLRTRSNLYSPETLRQVEVIAQRAGDILRDMFDANPDVWEKKPGDFLTEADMAAHHYILEALGTQFPDTEVWSEEGARPDASSAPLWVVDPLDGTANYAHHFPNVAVSIALHAEGAYVLGVVHDPLRGHTFAALRGHGATLDGRPIHVSEEGRMARAFVACDWARGEPRQRLLVAVNRFAQDVHALRSLGAAALGMAYVAAGWLEGYFNVTLQPWDFAAGVVIVEEAGGRVSDWRGAPLGLEASDVLCANSSVYRALLARVSDI